MRSWLLVGASLASALAAGPGLFDLYYFRPDWSTAYLHYSHDGGPWNSIPGDALQPSSNASFPASAGWKFIEAAGNAVVFVLTNGVGDWDNNGGRNYVESLPGVFSLQNGNLQTIASFPKGCPGGGACSGHGVCDNSTYTCTCASGYWGPTCASACPGGAASPCSNHGTCDPNAGTCTCAFGWASCSPAGDCSTPVSSDPNNCGGCGVACTAGPGVASATCQNATCVTVCDAGYVKCADGSCAESAAGCALPGCQTFSDNQCAGNQSATPASFEARRWQTPLPGAENWQPSFQSLGLLQAHPRLTYTSDRTGVNITVVALTRFSNVSLSFSFNGTWQSSPTLLLSQPGSSSSGFPAGTGPIYITIKGNDSSTLVLDEVDLLWDRPAMVDPAGGDYRNGQKGAIVELFGWRHEDIALECQVLARAGYLGAKLYTVSETLMSWEPFQNVLNPWFFIYQPVSYRLQGRFGNRTALRNAINTCRSLGVRMYADAVINHMTGGGNDANPDHRNGQGSSCTTWGAKTTTAEAPSPSFTQDFCYRPNENTGLPPSQEYASVPYGPTDFHCECPLDVWTDCHILNTCWLDGLVDLNTEQDDVQQRIADYMTDLLSIGFSGFRVDAAKHMNPDDLVGIFAKLKANMGGSYPADFIVYMEVLLGGEADMLLCNTDSGCNYATYLSTALANAGLTSSEVDQLKIWYSAYPKETDVDCGQLSMVRKVIENDDSDQQTPGSSSRDMGSDGSVLVKDMNIPLHRSFEVKLFQDPYGVNDNNNDYPIRLVLSSFYFNIADQPYGFPDGNSNCALCQEQCDTCQYSVNFTAGWDPTAEGYAGPVYTRVHRDDAIVAAMRAWMGLPSLDEPLMAPFQRQAAAEAAAKAAAEAESRHA